MFFFSTHRLAVSTIQKIFLVLIIVSLYDPAAAQSRRKKEKDSIAATYILDEVEVIGKRGKAISDEEYQRLRYRVRKVWPYAVLAAQYLQEIDQISVDMSKRKFRKEVTVRQKELFDNFSGILKQFSRKEGQVLIKLIYRQTGISAYHIAKELKSGTRAFFWNTAAGFFSLSLKAEYRPTEDVLDYHIEQILQDYFVMGTLPYVPDYTDNLSYFCTTPNIVKK